MFNPLIQSLVIAGGTQLVRTAGGYIISVVQKNVELAPLVMGTQWVATKVQMAHTTKVGEGIKRHIDDGLQQTNAKIDANHLETLSKLDSMASLQSTGLQSLTASVGVLQASTAVIGVGVVAIAALSAVNLYQTMKLREDVKNLRLEVKEGFIDLKEALKNQGKEILERIDLVAQDVEFRHHRTILAQAYGYFLEATKLMQKAMLCEDLTIRNHTLETAKGILTTALANYNNPQLLSDTCAAGLLRRYECAWAIEQTMAMVFQMQEQPAVVSQSLSDLKNRIRKDTLTVINKCETEEELDFLFPEITRIHDHDLAVLESWQNHIDWLRTLPESELKLLESAEFNPSEIAQIADSDSTTTALEIPPEMQLYESLKQKSHYESLLDQMRLMMQPELRRQYELYVSEQSAIAQHKTLTQPNLQQASNLAVANLYWYFKHREQTPAQV